jgi:hypothetical protein
LIFCKWITPKKILLNENFVAQKIAQSSVNNNFSAKNVAFFEFKNNKLVFTIVVPREKILWKSSGIRSSKKMSSFW